MLGPRADQGHVLDLLRSHPAHRYFVAAKHCEFMLGGRPFSCAGWARNWPGPAAKGHTGKMPLPAVMTGSYPCK